MTVLLYLLPLGLIFDLCGYLPASLRLAGVYGLLWLPLVLWPSKRVLALAGGLLVLMGLRAWLSLPPLAEMGLLLAAHQWIWHGITPVPRALHSGVLAYAVIHVALFLSPLGHPVLEAWAAAGNGLTQWIAGQQVHLGPSYQNLGALGLFLTLSLFSWEGGKAGPLRSGGYLLVALLLNALAAVLLIEKADFAANFSWTLKFRDPFGLPQLWEKLKGMAVVVFPGLLFLAQMTAFAVLHFGRRDKAEKSDKAGEAAHAVESDSRRRLAWLPWPRGRVLTAAVALVAALLVLVPPTVWLSTRPRPLVFVERGVVSFTKPDYTRYGEAAGGMFGMLPEYARLYGWDARVVKDIPDPLDPREVLVLTNLDQDVGADTHKRIWEFVNAGGALWVLGDHTFIKNGRNHLNELLEPCHIALVNDSAQFFPQGWFHSYRFAQGTPFGALYDDAENRPAILVGASLVVQAPAMPLVLGRFGYSDLGLETPIGDRGYLGDFKYQPGERLGDLVLVAGEPHGKGRVLVYGDTSSFFNNNLARSHELLQSSLGWLGGGRAALWPASAPWRGLAWLLAAACIALFALWRHQPLAPAAVVAFLTASWVLHQPGGLPGIDRSFAREHLALIDFSHHPLASKHSAMDNGLHGVAINLLRHGKLPVATNHQDPHLLDCARLVVLNAPRKAIRGHERRELMRFMERGGTVVLGCGYLDAAGSKPLLDPLGLRIGSTPLGRFFDREAYGRPVSFMSAWALEKVPADAKVLCASAEWPLMAEVPVGKGRLVLIGDSEFLHNRNVEGHKNHDPANTAFLKSLFDSLPP